MPRDIGNTKDVPDFQDFLNDPAVKAADSFQRDELARKYLLKINSIGRKEFGDGWSTNDFMAAAVDSGIITEPTQKELRLFNPRGSIQTESGEILTRPTVEQLRESGLNDTEIRFVLEEQEIARSEDAPETPEVIIERMARQSINPDAVRFVSTPPSDVDFFTNTLQGQALMQGRLSESTIRDIREQEEAMRAFVRKGIKSELTGILNNDEVSKAIDFHAITRDPGKAMPLELFSEAGGITIAAPFFERSLEDLLPSGDPALKYNFFKETFDTFEGSPWVFAHKAIGNLLETVGNEIEAAFKLPISPRALIEKQEIFNKTERSMNIALEPSEVVDPSFGGFFSEDAETIDVPLKAPVEPPARGPLSPEERSQRIKEAIERDPEMIGQASNFISRFGQNMQEAADDTIRDRRIIEIQQNIEKLPDAHPTRVANLVSQSIPFMAATTLSAYVGGPAAAIATADILQTAYNLQEYQDAGIPDKEALARASIAALPQAALEAYMPARFANALRGKRLVTLGNIVKDMGVEGATELLQETITILGGADGIKNLEDVLDVLADPKNTRRIKDAGIAGVTLGGIFGGVSNTVNVVVQRRKGEGNLTPEEEQQIQELLMRSLSESSRNIKDPATGGIGPSQVVAESKFRTRTDLEQGVQDQPIENIRTPDEFLNEREIDISQEVIESGIGDDPVSIEMGLEEANEEFVVPPTMTRDEAFERLDVLKKGKNPDALDTFAQAFPATEEFAQLRRDAFESADKMRKVDEDFALARSIARRRASEGGFIRFPSFQELKAEAAHLANELKRVAREAYNRAGGRFSKYVTIMKEFMGDAWDSVKKFARGLFSEVESDKASAVSRETGELVERPIDPSDLDITSKGKALDNPAEAEVPTGENAGKVAGTPESPLNAAIPETATPEQVNTWAGKVKQYLKDSIKFPEPRMSKEIFLSEQPISQETLNILEGIVREAEPIRGEVEILRTEERARRASEAEKVFKEFSGREALRQGGRAFSGELPNAAFEPIADKLTNKQIDEIINHVVKHDVLDSFAKIHLGRTMESVVFYGHLPRPHELAMIEKVFGSKVAKSLFDKASKKAKLLQGVYELINLPRSAITSFDLSATGRQGLVLGVSNPNVWQRSFKAQVQAFGKKEYAVAFDDALRSMNGHKRRLEAGLELPSIESDNIRMTDREEAFMSNILQKFGDAELRGIAKVLTPIKAFGQGVAASNRAYVTFLNSQRASLFDQAIQEMESVGIPPESTQGKVEARRIAKHINSATGRGNISFGDFAPIANALFFSPKFLVARFEHPIVRIPMGLAGKNKVLRRQSLRELVGISTFWSSIAILTKLAAETYDIDMDVEIDPRSSDFLKFRFGKTRVDMGAGYGQIIRLFALLGGDRKNIKTGKLQSVTPVENIGWFLRYKLAPVPSAVFSVSEGRLPGSREDVNFVNLMKQLTIPIVFQEIPKILDEHGAWGLGLLVPEILGFGVNVYEEETNKRRRSRAKRQSRARTR